MSLEQGVFTAEQAIRLTGITRRQLDYWMRTDLIAADIASGSGRGSVRLFTFQNLLEIRVAAWLRDQLSLQLIRKIVGHLRAQRDHPLAELQFAVVEREPERNGSRQSDVIVQRADGTWEKWTGQQMLKVRVPIRRFSDELTKAAAQDRSKRRKVGQVETRRGALGSAPVLAGTRIPTAAIWRLHEAGYSTERILENYPGLKRGDVKAALEEERRRRLPA